MYYTLYTSCLTIYLIQRELSGGLQAHCDLIGIKQVNVYINKFDKDI